jgi:hypothetical protein
MRLFLPSFFPRSYEESLQKKLSNSQILCLSETKYSKLVDLNIQASKIASSIHELAELLDGNSSISTLEGYFSQVMEQIINQTASPNPRAFQQFKNSFIRIEKELEANPWHQPAAFFFLILDAIQALVCALGVLIFAIAITTSPFGVALLATAMTVISTLALLTTLYNAYVEGRFVEDIQLKEIRNGITFLAKNYITNCESNESSAEFPICSTQV